MIKGMTTDRADLTRAYYDDLGNTERSRLTKDVAGRVSFEVHRRFLSAYVGAGDRVLEIGAGPGRFTDVLADLGARIVVTDISEVQLDLNRRYLAQSDREGAVERRELLDVCDTSRFGDGEFDAVVAFGGPLSYAFEAEVEALRGLIRVTRSGGHVLASVMSSLGTWRRYLPGVTRVAETIGENAHDRVLATGDLRGIGQAHECRMFRASELGPWAEAAGGRLVAASASNWASLGDTEVLKALEADPVRWRHFLQNEVNACREPGALDGGTHILLAVVAAAV